MASHLICGQTNYYITIYVITICKLVYKCFVTQEVPVDWFIHYDIIYYSILPVHGHVYHMCGVKLTVVLNICKGGNPFLVGHVHLLVFDFNFDSINVTNGG